MRLNIDGQSIKANMIHTNSQIAQKVFELLESNTPFQFYDEDGDGPCVIPSKLAILDCGDIVIHSGIDEFNFSISWYVGIWGNVKPIFPTIKESYKKISGMSDKLIDQLFNQSKLP